MLQAVTPNIVLRAAAPIGHLGPGVQAADTPDMHVPRYDADAHPARPGHALQALHEGGALAQVRPGVPVVDDVIQQIRMPEPGQAACALLIGVDSMVRNIRLISWEGCQRSSSSPERKCGSSAYLRASSSA